MRKIQIGINLILMWAAWAQTQTTTIQTVSNYNGWGWETVVMQNDLVTVATMPAIGARIMQYDLGSHPSLFVNPAKLRTTPSPDPKADWPNHGGFKNWPAPQNRWGWPPPPVLDYGAYTTQIAANTSDSVSVFVSSPVEKWLTPNLRFERKATLFAGSSRVRMEQTLINEGTAAANWSVWDITQCIVNH